MKKYEHIQEITKAVSRITQTHLLNNFAIILPLHSLHYCYINFQINIYLSIFVNFQNRSIVGGQRYCIFEVIF